MHIRRADILKEKSKTSRFFATLPLINGEDLFARVDQIYIGTSVNLISFCPVVNITNDARVRIEMSGKDTPKLMPFLI